MLFYPVPEYTDHVPIQQFLSTLPWSEADKEASSVFLARRTQVSDVEILNSPNPIEGRHLPAWATHVVIVRAKAVYP